MLKFLRRENEGITLIALVITIILLLILAGITILQLTGNGLLEKAKQAKEQSEIASIKEEIQAEIFAVQINNEGEISESKLNEILIKYDKDGEVKTNENNEQYIKTKEGYEIKVSDILRETTKEDKPKDPIISDKSGANKPNVSKIAQKTYVTWNLNEEGTEYVINDTHITMPNDWYNYENGKWANIKTTKENEKENGIKEKLEAYWVWIPRYEYVVPTSATATETEVRFIGTDKKEGAEGYTKQTDGTIKSSDGYTIHPVFTNAGNGGFGELDGIWVAKFEASSNTETPDTNYGGGNDGSLKVQVKPVVQSWRNITTNNIFTVCGKMTGEGEVLEGSTVDSHMMKNIEWGAVAILSQSKYGVYNPQSSTGETRRSRG